MTKFTRRTFWQRCSSLIRSTRKSSRGKDIYPETCWFPARKKRAPYLKMRQKREARADSMISASIITLTKNSHGRLNTWSVALRLAIWTIPNSVFAMERSATRIHGFLHHSTTRLLKTLTLPSPSTISLTQPRDSVRYTWSRAVRTRGEKVLLTSRRLRKTVTLMRQARLRSCTYTAMRSWV